MTRLWLESVPVTVEVNGQGLPVILIWNGRRHQVALIANHWRVDMEWWQRRVWRHYYKLATESGLLVLVYQDLVDEAWYLQRIYD
jgi:hypothetical protein